MKTINTHKRFPVTLFFILFFMMSGCEKKHQDLERIIPGVPFDCKIGTTYKIKSDFTFSIINIRDYRCPRDYYCIWSGDVELGFRINHYDLQIDTTIYAITRRNNPFNLAGYKWEVLQVDPWLSSGQKISSDEYQIRLLIN